GFRALYCIIRYNLPHAPLPVQFAAYVVIGGGCGLANLLLFWVASRLTVNWIAAPVAFVGAAVLNYVLCISLLFRRRSKWSTWGEIGAYGVLVAGVAAVDTVATVAMMAGGTPPLMSKAFASCVALLFNFLGRRFLVFPERALPSWAPTYGERRHPLPADSTITGA